MKTTRRDGSGRGVIGFALIALLGVGCPDGVGATDGGGEPPADALPDVALDDLADVAAKPDDGGRDAVDDPRDASDRMDAPRDDGGMDAVVPGCIPGMSVACACEDGRTGAQVCRADGTFAACQCVTADAATDARPDVVLPPLGPRLITPQSVSRVTSRRPTMRWVLPEGVTRARVELCGDRACTRMLQMQEVTGTSWRPAAMLAPGVVFWRVRGLAADGSVVWTSATWEYLVGRRDAPVDTSFGTLKDFNNDGYDDAASLGNYGLAPPHVSIIHGRSEQGSHTATYEIPTDHDDRLHAGDFNGDGSADLIVPIGRLGSGRFSPAGSIQAHHGRNGQMATTPDWRFDVRPVLPGTVLWNFETAVGDFDGDGFSDLALIDGGEVTPMGQHTLRLFRGSSMGLSAAPSRSQAAPEGFVYNGNRMTGFVGVGDVNQDGYADLLATYHSQNSIDRALLYVGRAWVILGGPSFPATPWIPIEPPTRDPAFGFVAAAIGDVNGDQHADFAISSHEVVSVYLGTTGAAPTRPLRTLTSPSGRCYFSEASFGSSLGNAGDYNGDGRADLSVGAYCLPYSGGLPQLGVGSVFVYNGTAEGVADAPMILTGTYPEMAFGSYLGGFGDFNADGFDDLSVVETYFGHDGTMTPRLWIYLGSATGVRPETTRWFFFENEGRFESPLALHSVVHRSWRGV